MKIREGLYGYPWNNPMENNCNAYVVDADITVLIDPGHRHLLQHLEKAMAEDGFRLEDVQLVIATHPHPDHCEGLSVFREKGAKVAMHHEALPFVERFRAQWSQMTGQSVPRLRPDFLLKEGDLQVGSDVFRVLDTPGHCPGSLCLYWDREKVLFTGDVVFAQSVGRVDLPGGRPDLLASSLEKLAELDAEWLLPGHGPVIRGRGAVKENFYLVRQFFQGLDL